jgi:Gpi18-like mannosyltransferase
MKKVLAVYFFWLIILLIVGISSVKLHIYEGHKCTVRGVPSYYRWDSFWYTGIARNGYTTFSEDNNSSAAFWPLYPLSVRFTHLIVPINWNHLAFYLSILYSFLATLTIYKLVKLDYSEKESFNFILLWLFFPAAYFLIAVYPESLFVLLAALSLYFARTKKWLLSGFFATLLALTKPYGILILPTLYLEYLAQNSWNWKIFWKKINWTPLLLPLVAVASFMVFNYLKFRNALAFLLTEKSWGRSYGNFFASLFSEARDNLFPLNHIFTGDHFPYLIYLASFIFSLWAFYMSWKKVRKTYLVFPILVLLAAISSGTLTSWGRYMFLAFPILIGPAIYLSRKKYLNIAYLSASLILLIFIASLFVRCYPME